MNLVQTLKSVLNSPLFTRARCDVCGKRLPHNRVMVTVCDSGSCTYEYYCAEEIADAITQDRQDKEEYNIKF